jgi:hypothetical protein
VKINAIPDAVTRWIVGRAQEFDERGKPYFTYARIAANLKRSQFKLELNERQIRRIVEREDPKTAATRAATRTRPILDVTAEYEDSLTVP